MEGLKQLDESGSSLEAGIYFGWSYLKKTRQKDPPSQYHDLLARVLSMHVKQLMPTRWTPLTSPRIFRTGDIANARVVGM